MNNEQIIELLDELGARLSGPTEQLFELAVRQVYVNFLEVTLLLVAVTATAVFAYRKFQRHTAGCKQGYCDHDAYAVGGLFVAGIALPVTLILWINGFGDILNPKYAALADLVGKLVGS